MSMKIKSILQFKSSIIMTEHKLNEIIYKFTLSVIDTNLHLSLIVSTHCLIWQLIRPPSLLTVVSEPFDGYH